MSANYRRSNHTVDSHTERNPAQVIVGGLGTIPGNTLLEKRDWLWRIDDGLCRRVNFEPPGSIRLQKENMFVVMFRMLGRRILRDGGDLNPDDIACFITCGSHFLMLWTTPATGT